AFLSSATSMQSGGFQPHLGPATGASFPNNSPEACAECHNSADTTFPVKDWQAPAVSFDLRTKTVLELAIAAGNVPVDEPRHFITDPRVLWALDSGVLPTRGGRNGVADDDHDGIDEASDRDGVIRTVPGGSPVFLQQIEEWTDSGYVTTAADAVCDITLVSRAANLAASGNGASSRPHVTWVANSGFSAPGRVGTMFIVFESDATNLIASDTNGATDIFRTAVDLISDSFGNLDLVVNGNTTLVSAVNGGITVGDGASTMASVGGADGNLIAFQSLATDLVSPFTDGNAANEADIYLRNIVTNSTELISHQAGDQGISGLNGGSTNPAIAAAGRAIAFESDATDLIGGDTNGVCDVYYTDISGGTGPFVKMRASLTSAGAQGSGGASRNASIFASPGGRTLVAFESDKTDLAPSLTAATNVYVFDSNTAISTLLNQQLSTKATVIGDGSARNPVIAADGANIAFESDATNIDFLRPNDLNGSTDVFLVDVTQALAGTVLPYRFSMTTIESVDGDGDSTNPCFGSFSSASSAFGVGFATYTTAATNLGTPDSTDLMVAFLDETFGVLADFTATPTGGLIPLAVQFTDISVGTPTAWQWDFDNDGTVDSTEQSPNFTYATTGSFTVKLTASNDAGSDQVTKTDFVVTVASAPVPDFSATPTSGPASLAVQFTDTSTENPTSWLWDFGDGNSSTQQNPLHTYTVVGTYTVVLTATNVAGSTTETKTNFVSVFTPVVASFTATPTTGNAPLLVNFDASGTTGATSYSWDFGDGSMGTGQTTSNTYSVGGTLTATLTATGPGGTDTAMTTITPISNVSFTIKYMGADVTARYATEQLDFAATGGFTNYAWDFGDGNSTTGQTAQHTYTTTPNPPLSTPGTYTVTVTASGGQPTAVSSVNVTVVPFEETATLNANADTTIYQELAGNSNSNGAGARFVVGKTAGTASTTFRRALLQFPLTGIPTSPAPTINEATITLTSDTPQATGAETISFHRLNAAWTEGSTNAAVGSSGIGAAAAGSGATWNDRRTAPGALVWGSAGGDFVVGATGTMAVNVAGSDTSTDLAADVTAWIGGTTNNGWILIGNEMTLSAKRFFSREAANAPQLVVKFQRVVTGL
ncbi:MAG: PKD repeat protein, partial [Planctomycetota bacterium]